MQSCMRISGGLARRWLSQSAGQSSAAFHPAMLELLACPVSKKPLRYDEAANQLVCDASGLAYPIVDGLPHLLPEAGQPVANNNINKQGQEQTKGPQH
eukprot:m.73737 g.73737  ORF g.73737 m.73737 type:complete len:98 (-) comp14477_c0_seq1:2069-2362(-)